MTMTRTTKTMMMMMFPAQNVGNNEIIECLALSKLGLPVFISETGEIGQLWRRVANSDICSPCFAVR